MAGHFKTKKSFRERFSFRDLFFSVRGYVFFFYTFTGFLLLVTTLIMLGAMLCLDEGQIENFTMPDWFHVASNVCCALMFLGFVPRLFCAEDFNDELYKANLDRASSMALEATSMVLLVACVGLLVIRPSFSFDAWCVAGALAGAAIGLLFFIKGVAFSVLEHSGDEYVD